MTYEEMLKHYDETKHVNYEERRLWSDPADPERKSITKYRCQDCVGQVDPFIASWWEPET